MTKIMFRQFVFNSSQILRKLGFGFSERVNSSVITMQEEIRRVGGAIDWT